MAHSKSALKRVRQNEKRRLRNRGVRSNVKTLLKSVEYAVKNNQNEEAVSNFRLFVSVLDKAVKTGVYHKNNAARKKSRVMKKINLMTSK